MVGIAGILVRTVPSYPPEVIDQLLFSGGGRVQVVQQTRDRPQLGLKNASDLDLTTNRRAAFTLESGARGADSLLRQ